MDKVAYEKLRWRCIRRGLLELDLVLEKFLDEEFSKLDETQERAFVALTELEDPDLWALISGAREVQEPHLAEVLAMLRKKDVRAPH